MHVRSLNYYLNNKNKTKCLNLNSLPVNLKVIELLSKNKLFILLTIFDFLAKIKKKNKYSNLKPNFDIAESLGQIDLKVCCVELFFFVVFGAF